MGAVWTYLGREESDLVSWLAQLDDNAFHHMKDPLDEYILGQYFVVTTFTTVGYGDVSAKKSNEMIIIMHYQVMKLYYNFN